MAINKDIGLRIKELRLKKKVNQTDYAKILGISRAALWQIETGKINPSLDLLYKISDEHNISIDYILLGKDRLILSDEIEGIDNGISTSVFQICFVEIVPVKDNLNKLISKIVQGKLADTSVIKNAESIIKEYNEKSVEWIEGLNNNTDIDHKHFLTLFEVYYKALVHELIKLLEIYIEKD